MRSGFHYKVIADGRIHSGTVKILPSGLAVVRFSKAPNLSQEPLDDFDRLFSRRKESWGSGASPER